MEPTATRSSTRIKKTTRVFLICLAILLLTATLNWGIISSWGSVKIEQLTLVGDDGLNYGALVYIPETATNETPAPVLLNAHGNTGNSRNQEAWSLEFARRGFIVVACDNYGSGDGQYVDGDETSIPDLFLSYVLDLPIANPDLLVTAGHSRGSIVAATMGTKYDAVAIMEIAMCGQIREEYDGNVLGLSGTADRPATLETVKEQCISDFALSGMELDSLELNTLYGSFEEGNAMKLVYLQDMIHEAPLVSTDAIREMLDFAMQSVGVENVPTYLDPNDQVWMWKDVMGFIAMCAFVAFLLTMAVWLMDCVPFFGKIRQPIPRNIGLRGVGLAISICAAIVFPLICLYTGTFGLDTLLGTNTFELFSMQMGNRAFTVVVGMNLLGLIMLGLFAVTDGKRHKAKLCDYGLTYQDRNSLSLGLIGRSFLLAALVLSIGFTLLELQQNVFGTELYSLFWGFRSLSLNKISHYPAYIIVWIICFVIASVGMNVERRLPSTGNDRADFVIACVFNSILSSAVILAVVLIHCMLQIQAGAGMKVMTNFTVDITRIWGMPFGMAAAGVGQTYLFRKTGSVWTGAFLMGTLCALTCLLYAQYKIIM